MNDFSFRIRASVIVSSAFLEGRKDKLHRRSSAGDDFFFGGATSPSSLKTVQTKNKNVHVTCAEDATMNEGKHVSCETSLEVDVSRRVREEHAGCLFVYTCCTKLHSFAHTHTSLDVVTMTHLCDSRH